MPFRDVFIGDLDDPEFTWNPSDEKYRTGNIPKRISEFFPSGKKDPYFLLQEKIESGEYEGDRVDWGAWTAKVTLEQIKAFIMECYPTKNKTIMKQVEKLNPEKYYALVAAET